MEPKFFSLRVWNPSSRASVRDRRFGSGELLPADYAGPLAFESRHMRNWDDLIGTGNGVVLFSENVYDAFQVEGISGLKFCPAIVNVPYSRRLRAQRRPGYFWGRAEGVLNIDQIAYKEQSRVVLIGATPAEGMDLYHLKTERGLAGYACTRRVVEAFRKHNIGNVELRPLDFYDQDSKPSFVLNLQAEEWPPTNWYPEGFVPHPNNSIQTDLPESENGIICDNTGAYGFDEVTEKSSGCSYELSNFEAYGWEWYSTPSSWYVDLPAELGEFFGHGITVKMDRFPADQSKPSKKDTKLLDEILTHLPQILSKAESELQQHEAPSFIEQIFDPTIYISCSERRWCPTWALVVEHLQHVSYGCHIEFEGRDFKEIWSGD